MLNLISTRGIMSAWDDFLNLLISAIPGNGQSLAWAPPPPKRTTKHIDKKFPKFWSNTKTTVLEELNSFIETSFSVFCEKLNDRVLTKTIQKTKLRLVLLKKRFCVWRNLMYQLGPLHMTDEAFINLVLFRQFMTAMRTRLTRESTKIHTPACVQWLVHWFSTRGIMSAWDEFFKSFISASNAPQSWPLGALVFPVLLSTVGTDSQR